MPIPFITEVGAAAERWLREGRMFAVNLYGQGIGSGSSISVLIRNPQGSRKYLIVTYYEGGADGKAKLRVHLDPQVSSDGSVLTPHCLLRPCLSQANFEAYANPSFSPGSETLDFVIPGGRGNKSNGSREGFRAQYILKEGEQLVIELVNRDTDDSDMHLYIEVYEQDIGR